MKSKLTIIFFLLLLVSSNASGSPKKWWELYFTSPEIKYQLPNNPEIAITRAIKEAKTSFKGAFFEISSPKVIRTLIKAHQKGIKVELVIDSDYYHNPSVSKMIKAGLNIKTDGRNGLMHNKFAIIDDKILWTGSYNLTRNGSLKNNNNALKIYSPELAEIYKQEFHEMFEENIYGNKKELGPFPLLRKKSKLTIAGSPVAVFFSPEDDLQSKIVTLIENSKKSIHFMAFSFTSKPIGEAMIKKFKEGIKVYGVFERRGSNTKYSEYLKMRLEGLPVKIDKNRYIMHHKVIILDQEKVLTGSFNFSKNANQKNDENILIIKNKKIAEKYIKEFQKIY